MQGHRMKPGTREYLLYTLALNLGVMVLLRMQKKGALQDE